MQFCSNRDKIVGREVSNAPKVLMTKWRFCLIVMMVEVDNVRKSGVNGLLFWLLVLSSASDMPMFWVWPMRNQWLWAHLSLSMLRESRGRSIKGQSSQSSLTHWVTDTALIGRMAEIGEGIVTIMVCCVVEGWRWRWWRGGWMGDVIYEMYWKRMFPRLRKV